MTEDIQTEVRGHILIIRLNRPEARNAFNKGLAAKMQSIIDDYDANPALRAAIIVAEGPTSSAGPDLLAPANGARDVTGKSGGVGLKGTTPLKPHLAEGDWQTHDGGIAVSLVRQRKRESEG